MTEVHEPVSFNEQASIRGHEEAIIDYAQNQKEIQKNLICYA
ncbi:MAG: hypothetical protein WBB08_12590 [Halobacteriota archaeon]